MMANKMKVGIIGNYLIGGPTIAVELYGAHFSLTTEDARALAEALLHVTTEAAPSTKDALIDRALTEALDALEDVQLIDNTVNEAFDAQSEIETILQVFAATARRIAHQEARDE